MNNGLNAVAEGFHNMETQRAALVAGEFGVEKSKAVHTEEHDPGMLAEEWTLSWISPFRKRYCNPNR